MQRIRSSKSLITTTNQIKPRNDVSVFFSWRFIPCTLCGSIQCSFDFQCSCVSGISLAHFGAVYSVHLIFNTVLSVVAPIMVYPLHTLEQYIVFIWFSMQWFQWQPLLWHIPCTILVTPVQYSLDFSRSGVVGCFFIVECSMHTLSIVYLVFS